LFPRIFVPMLCRNPGRLYGRIATENSFTEIESVAIQVEFLVEVDVDGTVIGTLYRRLDVAVFYPWENTFGD
jgi:hypothetical protein